MATLKAALFDLDGTLFDTEGQYTDFWQRVGQRHCPHMPDFAQRIKGTTLAQIFAAHIPDHEAREAVRRDLDEWETGMDYRFFPGAREFVAELRAGGVKTALVTSSDTKKMRNVYRKVAGFKALFDRILTSEDFAASKPAPDCYLRAAEALGCGRDECVVFEDALSGIEAGMNAGIFTIGIATTNGREVISRLCDHVLDSLAGLTVGQLAAIAHKAQPYASCIG